MVRIMRLPLLTVAALFFSGISLLHAQTGTEPLKKVLVLHLMRKDEAAAIANETTYQTVLTNGLAGRLDYYSEHVDLARFGDGNYQIPLRDFLKQKYKGTDFDVIIATADLRNFLAGHGREVFSQTPVVFAASDDTLGDQVSPPNFTGIIYETNLRGTLDVIRRLQPGVRRIFVVTGASQAVDKWHEARAKAQFGDYNGGLEFTYLSGLPMSELKRRVAGLTADAALYFMMMAEDGAGNRFASSDALDQIAAASSVPIYTWHDSYLGHGVVGGKLASSENLARKTAEIALRILHGESVATIPIARTDTSRTAFDWRQLQRWNLDEQRLPSGAEVLFREPTFWQRYRTGIVVSVSLLVLQSALILTLLVERGRRRKAARDLRESEQRYRNVVETQTELICRFLPDSTLTFVNDAYCKYFGRSADQLIGTKFVFLVPESERDSALRYFESLVEHPRSETREHPVILPDGTRGWQQWTNTVICSGGTVELQGVGRDTSERKQLEERLLEDCSERVRAEGNLRKLSARLMNLQDDERRRIARDLHDGTTQDIAAIGLNVRRLKQLTVHPTPDVAELLEDSQQLASQCVSDLRTLSYLLHPPILDQAGLVHALQWFIRGFSERSGIHVDTTGLRDIGRLPQEVETAFFRIVQESLTNVRRHSGSETAIIRLEIESEEVRLQISDRGHGIQGGAGNESSRGNAAVGVGISGMHERLIQLGGRLEVESGENGTTINAAVPLVQDKARGQEVGR